MRGGTSTRSATKVASGTILALGLVFGFIERRYAPDVIVSSYSTILPGWVGWLGWLLVAGAAIVYFVVDILEWRERREEVSNLTRTATRDRAHGWHEFVPAISAALVALVVGLMAYVSATAAVRQQYVALAIVLLGQSPKSDSDKELRSWAVDVFVRFAPGTVPPAMVKSLREGATISLSGHAVVTTSGSGTLIPPQPSP